MIYYFDPNNTEAETRKAIANRIRKERGALGLSQTAFAEHIGFSKPTIVSWEHKDGLNRIPTMDQIMALCNAFNCEPEYILCIIDTKSRTNTDIIKETGLSEAAVNILRLANREDSTANNTIQLVDRFIRRCTPIADSLKDLCDAAIEKNLNETAQQEIETKKLAIFNRIYDGDYPDYMKPLIFIDEAIKTIDHGWCGEGYCDTEEELKHFQIEQKNRFYQDYIRYVDDRKNDKTAMHRYNMNLTFNQIIDGILDEYKDIILTVTPPDEADEITEQERQD